MITCKNLKGRIYLGLVTKTYSKFYKKLKSRNFKIFVIDEEGLMLDDEMYLIQSFKIPLINIENLFTWGNEHKEIFQKNFHNLHLEL